MTNPLGPALRVTRVMSATRQDFLRLLPVAAEGREVTVSSYVAIRLAPDGELRISLEPAPDLSIGPTLRLARITVHYDFHGVHPVEVSRFLERFEKFYQRGGG